MTSVLTGMLRGRRYLMVASLLAGVIFVAANLLFQPLLGAARIDFTEQNLYTLSAGTSEALQDIAEPVDITFVYTRSVGQDYPAVRAYAARVRELLDTYRSASGGKLRVREIDPTPFSSAEDEALAAGITAVATDGTDPLYFGVIGRNMVDDERVIPFLAPERETSLEYDLTRMIDRLDNPAPPRVGILSSLRGMTMPVPDDGYLLLKEISKSFEIEQIGPQFVALPVDMDVLLVAHPPSLTLRQSWAIDQYILGGGQAIFLVDPAAKTAIIEDPFTGLSGQRRSDLGRMSEAWGIALSMDAVADVASALPVPVETSPGRTETLSHPLFIASPAGTMNQDDVITADLSRAVNFGAPGAFDSARLAEGLTFSPLIITGPSPSFIDAAEAVRDITPQAVLDVYESAGQPIAMAGRLSGRFTTAFPAGAPALELPADPVLAELMAAEAANAPEHIMASVDGADPQVLVIGDVDFLADDFYVVPDSGLVWADNAALVLNGLDALSGGGELSKLRSRAASLRPMTRIEDMREAAEAQYFRENAELQARLETAQTRLQELQAIGSTDDFFAGDLQADLSETERSELAGLRADIVDVRGRLRDIQRDYRRDIDRLEGTLKTLNIWGGPVFVGLIGFLVWRRGRRRKPRRAKASATESGRMSAGVSDGQGDDA